MYIQKLLFPDSHPPDEFRYLNPDGSKKHKQLAARGELLTGNTDNGSSRTVYVAKQLLARDDNDGIIDELPEPDGNSSTVQYLNELSMGQEQLNAKVEKAKASKPPKESRAELLARTNYDNENKAVDWTLM